MATRKAIRSEIWAEPSHSVPEQALSRQAGDPDILVAEADADLKAGRLEAAMLGYQRALHIEPRHGPALVSDGRPIGLYRLPSAASCQEGAAEQGVRRGRMGQKADRRLAHLDGGRKVRLVGEAAL